jgi:GT2 family glycosyltransferase
VSRAEQRAVRSQTATDTPGVTVVICTRHRPQSVVRVLESLAAQDRPADATLVIDASEADDTEAAVRAMVARAALPSGARYWRMAPETRGLPRQRNFALSQVSTDLVAFFDDDVVLAPQCLAALERTCRSHPDIVGVGCVSDNELCAPSAVWRLRRRLGIVDTLQPGRYCRTGVSTPWAFARPASEDVEGDWLPGCGMMWRTAVARAVRFRDSFRDYAQGEDLDFSLRARRHGRIVLSGAAHLRHLHEPAGRPDAFRLGRMELYNRYVIHRELPERTADDVARFVYAWTLDTLLLARHLLGATGWRVGRQMAGRLSGGLALLWGR